MSTKAVEEFARVLVQKVRDAAIESCDQNLSPSAAHAIARRWRESAATGDVRQLVDVLIPDVVDATISFLLGMIDQEVLRCFYETSEGAVVDLALEGSGEMSGWYRGTDGWIERYSAQRYVNDFAALDHLFEPNTNDE